MSYPVRLYTEDGLYPHQVGYAILASGNIAIVEPNGDVIDIIDLPDWLYEDKGYEY